MQANFYMLCTNFRKQLEEKFPGEESRKSKFESKSLTERALKHLPKKLHIEFLMKVSKFNYSSEHTEEGRRIIEAILSGYPKRTDVHATLVDLETKWSVKDDRSLEVIRKLFQRGVTCGAGQKKVQKLFEKWVLWEHT